MAIALKGKLTGTGTTNGSGNLLVDVTALSIASGDFVLVGVSTGEITTNAAFTGANLNLSGALTNDADLYSSDTNDVNAWTAHGFAAASDTTINLAYGTASALLGYTIRVYTGVNATTPLDVARVDVSANNQNTDRANPGSITPVTAGSKVVSFYFGSQSASVAWTAPTGQSNFEQARSSKTIIGSGDADWTSGAFDPAAVTGGDNNAADSYAAVTYALRSAGSSLTASAGSFTLTGADVSFPIARRLTASSGSFTLTGASATLAKATRFAADSGAFVLTGADVSFRVGKTMTASAGSFVLTGSDAGLIAARIFTVSGGSFALTGSDVTLRFFSPPRLDAESGSFSISFFDAAMTKDRPFIRNRHRRGRRLDYGTPIWRNIGR